MAAQAFVAIARFTLSKRRTQQNPPKAVIHPSIVLIAAGDEY